MIDELPGEKADVCFGTDTLSFFKPSCGILFGVRYDEFPNIRMTREEWNENNEKLRGELDFLLDVFETSYKSLNGIPISLLIYNDYSVVSLNGEFEEEQEAELEDVQKTDVAQTVDTQKNIEKETPGNNIIFY